MAYVLNVKTPAQMAGVFLIYMFYYIGLNVTNVPTLLPFV